MLLSVELEKLNMTKQVKQKKFALLEKIDAFRVAPFFMSQFRMPTYEREGRGREYIWAILRAFTCSVTNFLTRVYKYPMGELLSAIDRQ